MGPGPMGPVWNMETYQFLFNFDGSKIHEISRNKEI